MKHELPIAIALLAIGCLPWIWQSSQSSEAKAATQPATPLFAPSTFAAAAPLAPWQQPTDSSQSASGQRDAFAAATSGGNINGAELLRQVADAFASGEPVFGDLEIVNHMLPGNQTIKGRFWSRGSNTGQSRLELIPDSAANIKLTQVCDGRFVYHLTEREAERRLRFYSLEKLDNQDAGIIEATLPATWISKGSIENLMASLADAFQFGDVVPDPENGTAEVVGVWKPDHLAGLMFGWVDHRELLPQTDWSKLPPQIPHGARIRFARTNHRWLPTAIQLFRFDSNSERDPAPLISVTCGPIVSQSMSTELFRIDPASAEASDETGLYNKRIAELTGKHRVADESADRLR